MKDGTKEEKLLNVSVPKECCCRYFPYVVAFFHHSISPCFILVLSPFFVVLTLWPLSRSIAYLGSSSTATGTLRASCPCLSWSLLDHSSTGQVCTYLWLEMSLYLITHPLDSVLHRSRGHFCANTPSPPLPLQTALSSLDMQVALLFHRFLPDLTGLQTQATSISITCL